VARGAKKKNSGPKHGSGREKKQRKPNGYRGAEGGRKKRLVFKGPKMEMKLAERKTPKKPTKTKTSGGGTGKNKTKRVEVNPSGKTN